MIVESTLKKTLRRISLDHGQSGRISGAVLRGQVFDQAHAWLNNKLLENSNPKRKEYDMFNHNCSTFVSDLVDHLGLESPFSLPIVIPSLHMEQFQLSNPDLEYDYATDSLEIFE